HQGGDAVPEDGTAVDHAAVLKQYLGAQAADDILHPKPQVDTQTQQMYRDKTATTLKSVASDANDVWGSLRAESRARVAQRSQEEADRLREAYNTYARDCIARRMAPVPRMFGDDDYGEFRKMLANPRSRPALERRRRKEVMYRQAQLHRDTYQMLTHNNPLPALAVGGTSCHDNNESAVEDEWCNLGVGRFLVSKSAREAAAQTAPEAYQVFDVTRKYDQLELAALHAGSRLQPITEENNPYLMRDMDSAGRRKLRGSYDSLRYRLVDETDAARGLAGQGGHQSLRFSERFAAEYAADHDPMSVIVKQNEDRRQARSRRSALAAATASALEAPSRRLLPPLAQQQQQSAPTTQLERRRRLMQLYDVGDTGWQPLSLGALLDYASDLAPTSAAAPDTGGAASSAFRFGRVPVWKTDSVPAPLLSGPSAVAAAEK
ncbi:hypothetical protein BOX15_Mlig027465g3, partial [Macrostomum lignano]